jgi:hypothetical protein
MRITTAQRAANESRIRAAMDRLLRGDIPAGGRCDVKTLATEASVDRTAFYGSRPYAHLRVEFEQRLQALEQAGERPDPRDAPRSPGSRTRSPLWSAASPRQPRRSRNSPNSERWPSPG